MCKAYRGSPNECAAAGMSFSTAFLMRLPVDLVQPRKQAIDENLLCGKYLLD